jgi:hypothetical protein
MGSFVEIFSSSELVIFTQADSSNAGRFYDDSRVIITVFRNIIVMAIQTSVADHSVGPQKEQWI